MASKPHIEIEHWDGPRTTRECVECPSVAILRERLLGLDGDKIDSVTIEIDGVGALTVGGGPAKFIVVSFPADGSSSHVETDKQQSESVELQVGGQTGVYRGPMILPGDMAFDIAERFLLSGEYDRMTLPCGGYRIVHGSNMNNELRKSVERTFRAVSISTPRAAHPRRSPRVRR